jgi:hypothetical protein
VRKRVTMPVVFVLIALVIGAGIVVFFTTENALSIDEEQRGRMRVGLDEGTADAPRDGDDWRHHEWGPPEREQGREGDGDGRERRRDSPREGDREHGPTVPGGEGLIPPPPVDDENHDPQMRAMRRTFRLEGDAGAAALPFPPSQLEAELVEVQGSRASVGDSCEVRVLPVRTRLFNCLVRVVCGGEVLYPNAAQTAGYVPCEVEDGSPVRAVDDGNTARDGDPLLTVDMRGGIVTVSDHGEGVAPFSATLRLGRRRML